MKRGSGGFGDRFGQIIAKESRGSLKQLLAPLFIACKRTTAEQGNLVPRKQWAGIHIVLPEPSPNDDVADSEFGLSRSCNTGEKDFGDGEVRNKVRCCGGRSDFAPSRKDHDHGCAPKMTRVIAPPPFGDDCRARGKLLQEGVDFLLHGGHDSNGHWDRLAV